MEIRVVDKLKTIDSQQWNALLPDTYPFLRHEFLHALEVCGCLAPATGWTPCHFVAEEDGRLIGAAPAYLKQHSYGEFVFDWSWADAYRRAGQRYYPKLLNAIPFTPSVGPRLLGSPEVRRCLAEAQRALTAEHDLSSAHALFVTEADAAAFERAGFLARTDCQYHWSNNDYEDFDDFLARLTAAKRKKIRRERRRVMEAGINIETYNADELDEAAWDTVYRFYASTYHLRGQQPYLNLAFFLRLRETMPDRVVVFLAHHGRHPVAAALTLRDDTTLYGRHWGSHDDYHSLHFEACYYQGIDYCIRHGLRHFDAGAQGEHKLSRGFVPVITHSFHWLAHPRLRAAVADFLSRETPLVTEYAAFQESHKPYRREEPSS